MISCAFRALRSASTRSLKTFGLFFFTVTPRSSILEKVPLKETLRSQPFYHGRVSVQGMVLSYRLWG